MFNAEINESFVSFSNAIIKEAILEKEELMKGLIEQRDAIIKKRQREISEKLNGDISREINIFMENAIRKISLKKNELRRKIFVERMKRCDEIIFEVIMKLKYFMKTNEYALYLERKIRECALILDFNFLDEIYVLENDAPKLKNIIDRLFSLRNIKIIAMEKEMIGGFLLKSLRNKTLIDCSFKSEIDKQREYLCRIRELLLVE